MGGLEEIIRQIYRDSEAEISKILMEAEEECNRISKEGQQEIAHLVTLQDSQFATESELYWKKIKSMAETKKKQDILRAKQNVIENILQEAQKKMESQNPEKYFELLLQIAKNNAHQEKGELYLNEKDLQRMPADFVDKLRKQGISLEVSKETVDIRNGFILKYGDVEENCTFQALIDTKRDALTDKVNMYVFN